MWPLWNLPLSELQTTFCHAVLFLLALALPPVLYDYRFPLCILCFWHPFKKKSSERNDYTRTCFGFSKTCCGSICACSLHLWAISQGSSMIHKGMLHPEVLTQIWETWGKKGCFCFWEQGWTTQLNAMLDRIWVLTLCKTWTLYTPSWKTEAVPCTISVYLLFLFLSWSKILPFKSWQIKFPPTQSVKELHCCCVSPAVSTLTGMVW